jgi:hypothetical protein
VSRLDETTVRALDLCERWLAGDHSTEDAICRVIDDARAMTD